VQYPTTDINWRGFQWSHTWISDNDDQRTIAQFISLEAKNSAILIHGWFPELYWLSEKMTLSRYVYTYNPPELFPLNIPTDEYAKLLSQVKEGDFEMIVIPQFLPPDEIINATKNVYEFTYSLRGYDFYSLSTKN
jgi:hypothetical protein